MQSGSNSRTGIKDTWDGESGKGIVGVDVEVVPLDDVFPRGGREGEGTKGIVKTTQINVESKDGGWGGNHTDRSWAAV